ncbi:hypothetical protein GGR50DRAFT_684891 [Xylaria sp. CBS 124048]|nr:hypothetical protein GGR50DRAFT_684891 [Xylaria sp. CBS 124048]
MANNAYNQSQDTSAKISEAKNAITGEIREAQRAIKDVHIDVVNTESRVRETRGAVDMARESIRSTHAAIKNTQDTIHDNHIELMEKQKECAAEVARVRKLLEEEARQREETRRLKEVVRYAQTQGLLQTSSGRTQSTRDRDRDRSSRSSSPETSSSSPGTRSAGRRSRANGEQDAQKRRQAEREKMKLELELEQSQQQQYADAMRGIAEMRQRQRLQNEHERWSRADWELDWRRRKELHFQGVRPQGGYYDDAVDAPASDTDSFVAHAGGHNNSHSKDRDGRIPHRGAPRCRQWDHENNHAIMRLCDYAIMRAGGQRRDGLQAVRSKWSVEEVFI